MKKLLLILAVLVAVFISAWIFKLKQPMDAPIQSTPSSSESVSSNSSRIPDSSAVPEPDTDSSSVNSSVSSDSFFESSPVSETGSRTEKEVIEQEVKDGDYTVKQQIVVTKTYDENGELVSTKKSDPVEVDRWLTR